MEINEIFKYVAIVWHEIYQRKFKAALLLIFTSFIILTIGIYKPAEYSSEVTIYADTQNVIKPLLDKQTSVTNLKQSRTAQVRDIIYSPRQLNKVVDRIYGKDAFPTAAGREKKLAELREALQIEGLAGKYIKISYQDNDANLTFRLLNEVVLLFVEDSANSKRDESRSAYLFIEQQVASYKQQLLRAEEKLKSFKSSHLDGTEAEVESRISTLRNEIEDLKIQEMESLTRILSLKKQLSEQDKFSSNDYEASIYHSRLKELQQRLDNLLLTYKDDYPEVVEIRYQISDIKRSVANLGEREKEKSKIGSDFNPLYSEISSKLATAQVEHNTLKNRLNAFKSLLEDAYQRRKRIANNQAELSELNRDSSVIKALYEDMLANKEKARLSMVLDIEGQGVNYKIQEPASYPTLPSGIRFLHFVIAAPILSLMLLIAIFAGKIVLDNKIRFVSQLSTFSSAPILMGISHSYNRSEKRKLFFYNCFLTLSLLSAVAIYLFIAITHKFQAPIEEVIAPLYEQLMESLK